MLADLHLKLEKRKVDEETSGKEEPLKRVAFSEENEVEEGGGMEDKEVQSLALKKELQLALSGASPVRSRSRVATPPLPMVSTPPPISKEDGSAPPNLRRGSIEEHIEQQHQVPKKQEGSFCSLHLCFLVLPFS